LDLCLNTNQFYNLGGIINLKFIFPQNYDFKNKLFGIVDYSTAFINLLWCTFVFLFSNLIFKSLTMKIFILVVLCFPLILLSFAGFNGENIIYIFT
jgi:hypothetical protein